MINGRICFKASEAHTLYNLFNTRANLHQCVYTHAKAKAIEFMVTDALVAADAYFKFDELIWEPARFKTIDDTLLKRIEWSTDDALAESRAIVHRLRCAREGQARMGAAAERCGRSPPAQRARLVRARNLSDPPFLVRALLAPLPCPAVLPSACATCTSLRARWRCRSPCTRTGQR